MTSTHTSRTAPDATDESNIYATLLTFAELTRWLVQEKSLPMLAVIGLVPFSTSR